MIPGIPRCEQPWAVTDNGLAAKRGLTIKISVGLAYNLAFSLKATSKPLFYIMY